MRSKNASPRVRVRHMRQPSGWTVPYPDLGDRHSRDKGLPYTCLRRLISLASPRGTLLKSRIDGVYGGSDKAMNPVFQNLETVTALVADWQEVTHGKVKLDPLYANALSADDEAEILA
jgi:hypothetical protein